MGIPFWGCYFILVCLIFQIYFGVNNRSWIQAKVRRKIESTPWVEAVYEVKQCFGEGVVSLRLWRNNLCQLLLIVKCFLLFVNLANIKCDDNFTLIGINIDYMLKFDAHVSEICNKASILLAVLKRLCGFLTKQGKLVGIPMGTNCAPLDTDLFLFCYEGDFIWSLSDNNQADVVKHLTLPQDI